MLSKGFRHTNRDVIKIQLLQSGYRLCRREAESNQVYHTCVRILKRLATSKDCQRDLCITSILYTSLSKTCVQDREYEKKRKTGDVPLRLPYLSFPVSCCAISGMAAYVTNH